MVVSANTRMSLPQQVKTVLALTFLDEPDRRVEFNHWHYWYNLQANPNQKAFDIGGQRETGTLIYALPYIETGMQPYGETGICNYAKRGILTCAAISHV